MPRRLLLLVLITALALVLGFWSFTPVQALTIVRHGGYWMVLMAVVVFGVSLWRSLRDVRSSPPGWRRCLAPALLVVAAAGLLHLHEPHAFKVVADEVVLSLCGKQMHFSREAAVMVRGYDYAGNFTPFGLFVDKRPLLFPFLLATLHDLTGFRPGNAFVLNALLSVGLMGLLLAVGRRVAGWGGGIAAVLLVATVPLVAQNVCGAGFELLNLVMILLTVWLAMRAAERPEEPDRLAAMVMSGVLLAQVRYESVVFLLPTAAVVVYVWFRQRQLVLPWPLLLAPLLLVIAPLQMNVFRVSQATWQLNDIAGADRPFGFRYFYDNVGHALNFFLSTDGTQANSILVGVAGALGVGFFGMYVFRSHREIFRQRPGDAAVVIFLAGLMVHTALMLCYFWGRWDDPTVRRLSLPAHLLLVLALVFVWPQLVPHPRRWAVLGCATLVYLVGFTLPSNAMHRATQASFAARTSSWVATFADRLGERTALAIDLPSGLTWLLYDKSSITPSALAARPGAFALHFRNHTFNDYFVVQRLTPILPSGARGIDEDLTFGDAFRLETVEERTLAPLYVVRLSRIVALDEAKLTAWATKFQERHQRAEVPSARPASSSEDTEQVMLWLRELP